MKRRAPQEAEMRVPAPAQWKPLRLVPWKPPRPGATDYAEYPSRVGNEDRPHWSRWGT